MLSQKYRFHGHGSLRYLHKNGQTVRDRTLLLKYIENTKRPRSRVAVVVGKKVAKSAVKRNRIRRRIFEIIRLHFHEIKPNHDMVFTVFTVDLMMMPYPELEKHVLDLLAAAHLYSLASVKSDKIE